MSALGMIGIGGLPDALREAFDLAPADRKWDAVAARAVDLITRGAAERAAQEASAVAQRAVGKVIEKLVHLLTPDQCAALTRIMEENK